MTRVTVAVPDRPYDIVIENGVLRRVGVQLREIYGSHRRFFVITVPPVRRLWGKKFMASIASAGCTAKLVEMPDGEQSKRLSTLEQLAERLVRSGADRDAVMVAFGGGVVGDVAGLLASVFMRGVDVVQVPTTVLAQVDASIGGKTGVNLVAGKNLIGTFHQPRAVLIDPQLLSTLPDREFRSGLYESLKCGMIGNPALFARLEKTNAAALRRDAEILEWVISESAKLKARIVSSDERESGLRQVLNFGHTIGHAFEADTRYRRFLHGEAVAWGMVAETKIAAAIDKCEASLAEQIKDAVRSLGPLPKVNSKGRDILKLLKYDKKTRQGAVHFALPRAIGQVEVLKDVPEKLIVEAIEDLRHLEAS